MGSFRAVLALSFTAALVAASPASATTSVGPRGTIVIDGVPTFPLALSQGPPLEGSTPWGTPAVDETVAAGVKVYSVGPHGKPWSDEHLAHVRAWNEAAAARGVKTWASLRELSTARPGSAEEERLRLIVAALRDSPGFGFWKGADEPWLTGRSPDLLSHPYSLTKSLDPTHLSILIQAPRGLPIDLRPYSSVTDVHGVDVYPVRWIRPNPNLHFVGRWTKTLSQVTPNRAVVTTLQVCASGSFDRQGGTGAFVMPTLKQARYMVYDAILNGARGLNFYGSQNPGCFTNADVPYGWNWTYWRDVLRPLVQELGPRGRLNAALLAHGTGVGIRWNDTATQVASRRVGRNLWIIAARHGGYMKDVQFRLPAGIRRVWVYREGRTRPVRRGVLTDRLRQWDVHVYRAVLPPRLRLGR